MRRNLSETEQRMITLLKADSRKSISEIATSLGISRVTAKKTLDGLVDDGVIQNFTITLDNEESNLVIVHLEDREGVPDGLVLEEYSLIDGTYIVVLYYEDLPRLTNVQILSVRIATKRVSNNPMGRVELVHCDLCGKEIESHPITVSLNRKTYYACCPTCEKGLKRRGTQAPA